MHSLRRWIYSLLFLIPFPVYSAVTYETVRVGPGVYAPSGATQHDVTVATRRPDGVSRYHNIRPTMPPGALGRLGRAAVRGGPAAVAVTGVIEGLGYLIDQATGDIKKEHTETVVSGNYITRPWYGTSEAVVGSNAEVTGRANCLAMEYCLSQSGTTSDGRATRAWRGWDCTASYPYGAVVFANAGRCYNNVPEAVTTIIDLDPSDYEIIDTALADQLTLQQKTDLARRILTMTNSEIATIWPELSALAEAVRSAEQAVYDSLTDPAVIPTPDQETIVEDGRYTLPDQQTDSTGGIWPAFCEWATFICAPFQESEHPPLPTVDLDPDEYDSGLPNTGVCPAPVEIVTNFGQWEISYDPACQFAESIRVPLLAISYLIAGFIVVGVRR